MTAAHWGNFSALWGAFFNQRTQKAAMECSQLSPEPVLSRFALFKLALHANLLHQPARVVSSVRLH